ncbi:MAG TPA: ABC transporter permease [Patescibacteria group bacterium]|nr:ABC transporter permease [Patescibacteria group bacterium]
MNVRRRAAIIRTIVAKDLREFSRDRVWMVLTPLMLVAYVGLFWLLPATVDETVTVGVYQRGLDAVLGELATGEGQSLRVVELDSPEDLQAAVAERREVEVDGRKQPVAIGIAFPDDFLVAVAAGGRPTVTVYVDAAVPNELRTAMGGFVREIAFALAGVGLPVTEPAQELIVLGVDRAGDQVSPQERMRPLFAIFILLVESIALAGLVAVEIQSRTAKAVLATPATVGDLLAAKGLTGTLLAFGQAVLVLLLIGSFAHEPLLVLAGVLVGSIMMAGVGMIAGSYGRDFMSTLFTSVVFILPLAIPAFAVFFPGLASAWVQVLPTYGIVQTLVGATAYGLGWADVAGYLAMAGAWCLVLFGAGWLILKRRVEAL